LIASGRVPKMVIVLSFFKVEPPEAALASIALMP